MYKFTVMWLHTYSEANWWTQTNVPQYGRKVPWAEMDQFQTIHPIISILLLIVIVVIDFLFPVHQMEVNLQVAGNTWAMVCFNVLNSYKQVFRSYLQNVDVSRHGLRRRHLHRNIFFSHYSFRLYILLNCQLWHLKRTRRRRRRFHIDFSISQIDFPVCAFTHSAPKYWWRARWRLCEVLFFVFFVFFSKRRLDCSRSSRSDQGKRPPWNAGVKGGTLAGSKTWLPKIKWAAPRTSLYLPNDKCSIRL